MSSKMRQIREIRNELPYTVSAIGNHTDLLAWRVKQKLQAEQDEIIRQNAVNQVKLALERQTLADKHKNTPNTSAATTKYERKPVKLQVVAKSIPKTETSIFSMIYNYIINLFLDIKYNQH